MKTVITYIFLFLLGFLILLIFDLLGSLINYFKSLTDLKITINNNLKKENQSFKNNIDSTFDILNLCKNLINLEVEKEIDQYIKLNIKYEYKNLDVDSKKIAEHVFNSLNHEMINENNTIVTTEYILEYIATESVMLLLQKTQDHNIKITIS